MLRPLKSLLELRRKRLPLKAATREVGVLVSFPKAGRTWLRVMLDELDVPFVYTHDGVKHGGTPRPFEELTLCARKIYRNKPVVFLSRDPRDVAVSGYFHKSLRRDGYNGTMADFIRDPLHGVEKIVRYNLAWFAHGAKLTAFYPFTYEETVADTFAVMRSIVMFVGLEVDDADIERVVANNTFERMHQREARDEYPDRFRFRLVDPGNPDSYHVRRGKAGGYVDYLSLEDIAYCDEILERYRYFDRCRELTLARPVQVGRDSV